MDRTIKDFLFYLIEKHDCSGCNFENVCNKLDDKKENCLCDKAVHSLRKKYSD